MKGIKPRSTAWKAALLTTNILEHQGVQTINRLLTQICINSANLIATESVPIATFF